jgi:hypothetical protein
VAGVTAPGAEITISHLTPFVYDDGAGACDYTWGMTGTVTENDGSIKSISVTGQTFTTIVATSLITVDFNARPLGLYSEAHLREDFNVGVDYNDTVNGPNQLWWTMAITEDPAGNTGRGRVLQVNRRANRQENPSNQALTIEDLPNNRGFRYRADFPATDEVWLYYETWLPSWPYVEWFYPLQHKMLGLINGTLLEAGHDENPPIPGGPGMNSREQMHGQGFPVQGTDGAMAMKAITADSYLKYYWWVKKEASALDSSLLSSIWGVPTDDIWRHPRGRWIGREIRVKNNSATDVWDGEYTVKLVDPQDGYNETIVRNDTGLYWTNLPGTYKWDGVYMYNYVGGDASDPRNIFPQEQAIYYDNIIVSAAAILL